MGSIVEALSQSCELRQEIKDLQARIAKDKRRLAKIEEEGAVTDSVTGTRRDGTIGQIKITGFPIPEYTEVRNMLKRRIMKLHILEDELQEAVDKVDSYINAIPQSRLRQLFRLYYDDDLTWAQVAMEMNRRYPKKKIPYTDESCRKLHDRYLEKI